MSNKNDFLASLTETTVTDVLVLETTQLPILNHDNVEAIQTYEGNFWVRPNEVIRSEIAQRKHNNYVYIKTNIGDLILCKKTKLIHGSGINRIKYIPITKESIPMMSD